MMDDGGLIKWIHSRMVEVALVDISNQVHDAGLVDADDVFLSCCYSEAAIHPLLGKEDKVRT